MITGIKLRRWKSHEQTEMRFAKGTNLFVGSMGSGKTSVVEAMCFALFGTFPALKARRIGISDLVSRLQPQANSAEIELSFEQGGKSYRVVRRVSRNDSSEAQVFCDGKLLEAQPQRANELLESVLKLDYELFSRIIFAEQNRIDALLNAAKGERKRQVDELLGISAFESARSNAMTLANRLKTSHAELQSFLEGLQPQELERQFAELQDAIAALEKNIGHLTGKLADLKEEKRRFESMVFELEKKEREFNRLSEEIASLEALLRRLLEELEEQGIAGEVLEEANAEKARQDLLSAQEELGALKKTASELASARLEAGKLEAALSEIDKQLAELPKPPEKTVDLAGIEDSVAQLAVRHQSLSEKIVELSSTAATLRQQLAEFSSKVQQKALFEKRLSAIGVVDVVSAQDAIEAVEKQLAEATSFSIESGRALEALEKAGATCPTCGSDLPEEKRKGLLERHKAHLGQYSREVGGLREQRDAAASRLKQAQQNAAEAEAVRASLRELEGVEAMTLEVKERQARVEKELSTARTEQTGVEQKLEDSRQKLAKAKEKTERVKRFERLSAERAKAAALLQEKQGVLSALASACSETALEDAERKLESLKKTEKALVVRQKILDAQTRLQQKQAGRKSLAFEPSAPASAREKLSDARQQEARLSAELAAEQRSATEKKALAASVKKRLDSISAKAAEISVLQKKIDSALKFHSSVVETQKALREQLVEALNAAMQEVWPLLYPYRDFKSIRLFALEDDYALELQDLQGEWHGVELCSGGERSCAALAMRISFAVVLTPNLSWLILDEPTHNLDSRAVQLLSIALHERLPQIVEQVFIITHDEALKEGASNKVFFFERGKDDASRTVVEEVSIPSG